MTNKVFETSLDRARKANLMHVTLFANGIRNEFSDVLATTYRRRKARVRIGKFHS